MFILFSIYFIFSVFLLRHIYRVFNTSFSLFILLPCFTTAKSYGIYVLIKRFSFLDLHWLMLIIFSLVEISFLSILFYILHLFMISHHWLLYSPEYLNCSTCSIILPLWDLYVLLFCSLYNCTFVLSYLYLIEMLEICYSLRWELSANILLL